MSRVSPDIKRGRLSDDEEAQIVDLAERRKLKAGQIALKLNRHPATVNFAMHRLGLRTLVDRPFEYRRGETIVRSFSPDEDAWITALRVQGYSTSKIAELAVKRWGHARTAATINMRLTMLANREGASA